MSEQPIPNIVDGELTVEKIRAWVNHPDIGIGPTWHRENGAPCSARALLWLIDEAARLQDENDAFKATLVTTLKDAKRVLDQNAALKADNTALREVGETALLGAKSLIAEVERLKAEAYIADQKLDFLQTKCDGYEKAIDEAVTPGP